MAAKVRLASCYACLVLKFLNFLSRILFICIEVGTVCPRGREVCVLIACPDFYPWDEMDESRMASNISSDMQSSISEPSDKVVTH